MNAPSVPTSRIGAALTVARHYQTIGRIGWGLRRIYQTTRRCSPDLAGAALYVEIVKRRGALSDGSPESVVWRAAESFADWPVERQLTLRDVACYLALIETAVRHGPPAPSLRGTQRLIAFLIPSDW